MSFGALAIIEQLKSGQLVVPESAVATGVQSMRLDGVQVKSCACTPEGVRIVLEKTALGVAVPITLSVRVQSIELNAKTQAVVFRLSDAQIGADTWSQKLVALLATNLVQSTIDQKIDASAQNAEGVRVARQADGTLVADLAALPFVTSLRDRKIPFIGTPVLDLVPLLQVEHAAGAVVLKKR